MVDIYFKATTTQCSKKRGRGNEIQLSLGLASYFEYSQKDEDNIMICCVINLNVNSFPKLYILHILEVCGRLLKDLQPCLFCLNLQRDESFMIVCFFLQLGRT